MNSGNKLLRIHICNILSGFPTFGKKLRLMQVHCFFHKRISAEMLMEVNEYLLDHKDDNKDNHTSPSGGKTSDDGTAKEDTNKGTQTLDAICAPANICYPQGISLLNETRERLENIIYRFCKCYSFKLPRRYHKCARKEYLAFTKSREYMAKRICSTLCR